LAVSLRPTGSYTNVAVYSRYRSGNTLRFPGAADEPPTCCRTAVSHLGLSSPGFSVYFLRFASMKFLTDTACLTVQNP